MGVFGLVDSWLFGRVKNDEEMAVMIDDWRGLLDYLVAAAPFNTVYISLPL